MMNLRPLVFTLGFLTISSVAVAQSSSYSVPQSFYNSQGTTANQTTATKTPAKTSTQTASTRVAQNDTSSYQVAQRRTKKKSNTESVPVAFEAEIIELRQQIDALEKRLNDVDKKASEKSKQLAGYSGGFFIKDADGKFTLFMNMGIAVKYSFGWGQEQNDVHGFGLRSAYFMFRGQAFTDKLGYVLYIAPAGAPPLGAASLSYSFNDHFNLEVGTASLAFNTGLIGAGSTDNQFITTPMAVRRFYTGSLGVNVSGSIVKGLSYGVGLHNGHGNGRAANTNNEMAYSAELAWQPNGSFGNVSGGDLGRSKKPKFKFDIGGVFSHEENNPEERIIMGSTSGGIKFYGFNFFAQGFVRLVDPDRFTRQQIDASAHAQLGYALVKDKLEIAVRYSALYDDINDVGVNHAMNNGSLWSGGGDPDGDSSDEYMYSFGLAYNILGKKLRTQVEYTYWYDGRDAQDRVNHIVQTQLHAKF